MLDGQIKFVVTKHPTVSGKYRVEIEFEGGWDRPNLVLTKPDGTDDFCSECVTYIHSMETIHSEVYVI